MLKIKRNRGSISQLSAVCRSGPGELGTTGAFTDGKMQTWTGQLCHSRTSQKKRKQKALEGKEVIWESNIKVGLDFVFEKSKGVHKKKHGEAEKRL